MGYADGTMILYRSAYDRFVATNSDLCGSSLCDLRGIDIQDFFLGLDAKPSAIKSTHKFMRGLFLWLNKNGYCPDLTAGIILPKQEQKSERHEIEVWDDESLRILLEYSVGHRLRFYIILAVSTGLRTGELRALKYSDFDNGTVTVSRQYQHNRCDCYK